MKRLIPFIAVCTIVGCSQAGFQDYNSPAGGFDVKFPAGTVQSKDQNVGAGIKQTLVGVERRDGAFQVFFQDLPFGQKATGDQAIDLVAEQLGGKVLYRGDCTISGEPGREYEVQVSKPMAGYLSTRLLVTKNKLYQLQVLGTNYRRDNADVQTFWNSFKLKS